MSAKGFDLEPDQRLSYRDPAKALYCYIGKASDESLLSRFKLPQNAFERSSDGTGTLTLLIREMGTGMSGAKPAIQRQVTMGVDTQDPDGKRHVVVQRGSSDVNGIAETSNYAKDTHALLASQSFQQNQAADSI